MASSENSLTVTICLRPFCVWIILLSEIWIELRQNPLFHESSRKLGFGPTDCSFLKNPISSIKYNPHPQHPCFKYAYWFFLRIFSCFFGPKPNLWYYFTIKFERKYSNIYPYIYKSCLCPQHYPVDSKYLYNLLAPCLISNWN